MDRGRWDAASARLFGAMVLAWAGNYLFVPIGERYVSPLWLATLRAAIGTLGLVVYLGLVRPGSALSWRDRRDAMLLGIPGTGIFLGLWFVAAATIPPGQAAVFVYTFPLWVALFSPVVLGSQLGRRHAGAVAVGFAGVVLVSEPWGGGAGHGGFVAIAELLGAAVCWAFATVGFQRRFAGEQLARVSGYQLLGGTIVLLAASLALGQASVPSVSPRLWIALLWLGVYGTTFAYAVWFTLLRRLHASTLSALTFLVPLVALALSAAFLGERLSLVQGGGVALVLAGLYLVGTSPLRHPAEPRTQGSGA